MLVAAEARNLIIRLVKSVDQRGCITRPKLMSRFTKIKNFGSSASVLSYAHFQAFKFPDSMEVHFQCTIQICRYQCPDQCSDSAPSLLQQDGLLLENHRASIGHADVAAYGIPPPPIPIALDAYLQVNFPFFLSSLPLPPIPHSASNSFVQLTTTRQVIYDKLPSPRSSISKLRLNRELDNSLFIENFFFFFNF
jgi:hypothetical protein